MRTFENDPLLGDELVFDLQLNEGAGIVAYDQMWHDPNGAEIKRSADFSHDVGAVDPAWAVEQIGTNFLTTLDFAWVLDTAEPFLTFGQVYPPFDRLAATDAFTIEAVFYADTTTPAHQLILGGWTSFVSASGPAFPQLGLEANGYFDFRPCRDSAGAGGYVVGTVDLSAGWHHIIASYSDSDDEAYVEVDGGDTDSDHETMTTTTNVYEPVANAEHVFVGARFDHANFGVGDHQSFWDGHIAFVRMWARRFNTSEKAQLFERCRNRYNL